MAAERCSSTLPTISTHCLQAVLYIYTATHHVRDQLIIASSTTTGTGGNGYQGSVGQGIVHRARLE